MKRIILALCLATVLIGNSIAKEISISPSNWWTNMQHNQIILLVENAPLNILDISINDSTIQLNKHYPTTHPNSHFLHITIPPTAEARMVHIVIQSKGQKPIAIPFNILDREEKKPITPLSAKDVIYQILPDRFCNANTKNDDIESYFEKNDRLNPTGVHGGDLEGIASKTSYINNLGFTAIELMPVLESNLMTNSYKRMAPTNHYKIDERLGTLEHYKNLVDSCNVYQLKFIQSFVLHQVGNYHSWYKHMFDEAYFYTKNYNYEWDAPDNDLLIDPYINETSKKNNRVIWEYSNFPTINQSHDFVAQSIIQHCIWWIEATGLQYIKIEQAARNTPLFIKRFYQALQKEYPTLTIVIDNLTYNEQNTYWSPLSEALPTIVCDYYHAHAIADAFTIFEEASIGIKTLYSYHRQAVHKTQLSNIIMLDNHQQNRAFTNADNDIKQITMMLKHLITTPGIPRIYYGTECLMTGLESKGLSNLSKDFPGGWADDEQNAFSGLGMSSEHKMWHKQLKKLLSWRRNNADFFMGDFYHYFINDEVYAFSRSNNDEALLIIINNSNNMDYRVDETLFGEDLNSYRKFNDVSNNDRYSKLNDINIKPKSIAILELKK
ncbi:alpha-amylase family glycosyl hydrolase [Carboxylicivirga sp. M1479]|uniref:alpha-amylase family glycosyl hydrolase n=1 Tax=Carboxylicivirga sp. M1479 TaxID=2594476 RepID=UPI0011785517|nr:alpha-amylase family glycosyl hydrolase [Carboxylicivirga sp. M1479]TRX70901.1 hypothetical protein FNN09_09570 [Carboxylicivirga sp. M1479]